jgi:hypothetical protein
VTCFYGDHRLPAHTISREIRTMAASQAAANALTNLARAAVGLGFAGSALSASMYDGTCSSPPPRVGGTP